MSPLIGHLAPSPVGRWALGVGPCLSSRLCHFPRAAGGSGWVGRRCLRPAGHPVGVEPIQFSTISLSISPRSWF